MCEETKETLEDLLGLNLYAEAELRRRATEQLVNTRAGLVEMRRVILHAHRTKHAQAVNGAVLDRLVEMSPKALQQAARESLLGMEEGR